MKTAAVSRWLWWRSCTQQIRVQLLVVPMSQWWWLEADLANIVPMCLQKSYLSWQTCLSHQKRESITLILDVLGIIEVFFTCEMLFSHQLNSINVTVSLSHMEINFSTVNKKRIYLKERWKSYLCWGRGMIRSGFVRTLVDRFGGHILRQHFWRGRRQLFFSWLHSTLTQNKVQFWNSNFVLHNGNPSIHLLLKMVCCIQHYVALLLLYVWFVQLLKLWLTFWPISR